MRPPACRTCGAHLLGDSTSTCGAIPCVRIDLAATRAVASCLGKTDEFREYVLNALSAAESAGAREGE